MKGDPKVIAYLNRALRSELTAVNQFWLHSRLQEDWGLGKMAEKSDQERLEEMQHADRLIARIIFLEGQPDMQHLDRLQIGRSPRETLENDLAAEISARNLYLEARNCCRDAGDFASMVIFEELIVDEEEHIDFLETELDLLSRIGEERFLQINASPMNAPATAGIQAPG